jgi:hypothetical protein
MTTTAVVGSPVARVTSSRILEAAAADAERLRTTQAAGADSTIKAFNASDVCANGK